MKKNIVQRRDPTRNTDEMPNIEANLVENILYILESHITPATSLSSSSSGCCLHWILDDPYTSIWSGIERCRDKNT